MSTPARTRSRSGALWCQTTVERHACTEPLSTTTTRPPATTCWCRSCTLTACSVRDAGRQNAGEYIVAVVRRCSTTNARAVRGSLTPGPGRFSRKPTCPPASYFISYEPSKIANRPPSWLASWTGRRLRCYAGGTASSGSCDVTLQTAGRTAPLKSGPSEAHRLLRPLARPEKVRLGAMPDSVLGSSKDAWRDFGAASRKGGEGKLSSRVAAGALARSPEKALPES
jgi:hypothetical protein